MKNSIELKQERASLIDQAQGLVDTAKAEKRELTSEEETSFDNFMAQRTALDAKITRAEGIEENQKRAAQAAGVIVGGNEQKEKGTLKKRFSLHKALRSQLPGGVLDGVEAELHQEALREAKEFGGTIEGVAVPNSMRADAQTVTQDSGNFGGKLVFEEYKGLIDALTPKPIVQSLGAQYMRGLTGPASFVTNAGGITATWEGEIDTVSPTKTQYGKKSMDAKRLSATVPISVQNLHQSVISLETVTANDIRLATERAIDYAVINGSGTGNVPLGILNAAGVNTIAMGTNGAAPTWAKLVEMITLLEDANAVTGEIKYLINALTKGYLKSHLHTAGDAKYLMSSDNLINGLQTGVSTFVPKNLTKGTGTNLSSAIAGDFSKVIIGEWGFSDMVVDNITRKKEGLIEITNNQYVDVLIKEEKAFTVIKDFDLS